MKKILLLLAGATLIISCNSSQKSSSSDSTKTDTGKAKTADAAKEDKPAATNSWVYKTDTDKMTSKVNHHAILIATNKLDFEAPYDGGSTASIVIRQKGKGSDVLLVVDKGQFNCEITDGCKVNIRFDNNQPISFQASEPSDGSSTILFISPEKKFIANVKKAKKMIVQAEFYQSGLRTMEFNVDGLKWDY